MKNVFQRFKLLHKQNSIVLPIYVFVKKQHTFILKIVKNKKKIKQLKLFLF